MKVFRSLESYQQAEKTVATIGTFDGLHNGHRIILDQVISAAKDIGGESVLISFHPHPRLVLFPDDNPLRLLQTIDEKIDKLEEIGVDRLLLVPFTKEFSRLTSQQFIENVLVDVVGIDQIIIGYDHHFGKGRTGGLDDLREGGAVHGFSVEEIPAVAINDAKISSTKIRNALLEGDLSTAESYLGYPYGFGGTVVEGEKLGRKLGFPTANIKPEGQLKLIPANGVYFVKVSVDGREFFGMMNIGNKPTAGEFKRTLEVHLLDFDEDIYGKQIQISFRDKLREEKKFPSLEALKEQLGKDREACLERIKNIA